VNISSIGGLVAIPHLAAYSASKFALAGLSDAFRSELAPEGIKVTIVFPGLMRTGSHVQAQFKGAHASEFGWFALASATPLTSMSANRAARQIVNACQRGTPHVVLSIQAKLLHLGNALMPNLSARITAVACRVLPRARTDSSAVKGGAVQKEFPLMRMTALADRASQKNNELSPE
jgi:short-subunit dehydrogenase